METLGTAIFAVGMIISIVGGVMFLVAVFRESVGWGLGLFVPLVGAVLALIFLVTHWDAAKKPFLINLLGSAVMLAAGAIYAMGSGGLPGAMADFDSGQQQAATSFESDLGGLDSIGAEDDGLGQETGVAAEDDWTVTTAGPEAAEPSLPQADAGGLEGVGGFDDGGGLAAAGDPAAGDEPAADSSDPFLFGPSARATERRLAEPSQGAQATMLTVESAEAYLGQRVKIVKKNGKVIRGRLIRADELRLTIEERMGGGTMSYPVRKSDVEKIELVGRE